MTFIDLPCPHCRAKETLWQVQASGTVVCNTCEWCFRKDYIHFLSMTRKGTKFPICPQCCREDVQYEAESSGYRCSFCNYLVRNVYLLVDIYHWKDSEREEIQQEEKKEKNIGVCMVVYAYDHFSTEDREESQVVVQFVGEYIGEDENYLFLRHCKADIQDEHSAEEVHKIFKPAIQRQLYTEVLDL